MRLSIIVIGDEILLGQVTDTNSGFIARMFDPEGWSVCSVRTVGDSREDIASAVREALAVSDLVVTTGGLGPTKDDITKGVLLEIFGGSLVFDSSVAENIREVFARRGLRLNALTEGQAMVPSSCRVIQNRLGTAPIMWFERADGKVLVSMPGVPFETEGMLPEVLREVALHFNPDEEIYHDTLIISGITESALAEKLAVYEDSLGESLHLAYLPNPGYIRLRLDGRGDRSAHERAFESLKAELGSLVMHRGDATPAEILLKTLGEAGFTAATAESCTGGNIAHRITMVAGSSAVFMGGVVSYANEVKVNLLGVNPDDIARHGAVSRQVVEQMALGACRATGADCAMATSGIAGPGGGSAEKPVGTVWIAWACRGHVESHEFHLPGNRGRVIDRATTEAILGLHKFLKTYLENE